MKSFYFFDLDHTLIKKNSSFCFGKFLYKKGILPFHKMIRLSWAYFLQKFSLISVAEIHERAFKCFFEGKRLEDMELYATEFVDNEIGNLINEIVYKRFLEAEKKGGHVAILSSSPQFLVEAFAKKLNILHTLATSYHIDDKGRILSVKKIIDGPDKERHVHTLAQKFSVPLEDTQGYSDSHLDLPFLNAVGHATVVNPDKKLHAISLKNAWEII